LCKYTPLPATEKLLKNSCRLFCKNIFSSSIPIRNYISSITRAPSLQCWFYSREQVKISWI